MSIETIININLWSPWLVAVVLNTFLLGLVYIAPKKLLTPSGIFHAWCLGIIIWGSLGWPGYVIIGFYFLLGSAVTRIGMAEKQAAGIAEKRDGARGPENVWGSAFTAALSALGILIISSLESGELADNSRLFVNLLKLAYVASLATKLADTCGSEVGKAYGRHTFLITTWQAVPRGTEGAISWEGTVAGVLASILMAGLGWLVGLISLPGVLICTVGAFIGTNVESLIGATLQTKYDWLTNEIVNVINTLVGAIASVLIALAVSFVTRLW